MNETENQKVESQEIPNYRELSNDEKSALETFIDLVIALDQIQVSE